MKGLAKDFAVIYGLALPLLVALGAQGWLDWPAQQLATIVIYYQPATVPQPVPMRPATTSNPGPGLRGKTTRPSGKA